MAPAAVSDDQLRGPCAPHIATAAAAAALEVPASRASAAHSAEVEQMMRCECCGLTEECTAEYVSQVRGAYCGKWVCGLCAEAVKEELGRGVNRHHHHHHLQGGMMMEDALKIHMGVCMQYLNNRKERRANPVADIALAMKWMLRRGSGGRGCSSAAAPSLRSAPSSPRRGPSIISRTSSCITPFSDESPHPR